MASKVTTVVTKISVMATVPAPAPGPAPIPLKFSVNGDNKHISVHHHDMMMPIVPLPPSNATKYYIVTKFHTHTIVISESERLQRLVDIEVRILKRFRVIKQVLLVLCVHLKSFLNRLH